MAGTIAGLLAHIIFINPLHNIIGQTAVLAI